MTSGTRARMRKTGPRRVVARLVVAAFVVAVLLLATAGVAGLTLEHRLGRADAAFSDLADRPSENAPQALDVLLVSTDMVTVLHVDGDRKGASMIWLPPDTEATVQAVERVTRVRIDHYVELDWSVLGKLEPTAGQFWPPYEPSTDPVERQQRQEDYLRVIIGGNLHQEMAKNPLLLYQFLNTLSSHLTVDREWSSWEFARLLASMHKVRAWDLQYLSAPTGATWAEFWDAVGHDRTDDLMSLAGGAEGSPGDS